MSGSFSLFFPVPFAAASLPRHHDVNVLQAGMEVGMRLSG